MCDLNIDVEITENNLFNAGKRISENDIVILKSHLVSGEDINNLVKSNKLGRSHKSIIIISRRIIYEWIEDENNEDFINNGLKSIGEVKETLLYYANLYPNKYKRLKSFNTNTNSNNNNKINTNNNNNNNFEFLNKRIDTLEQKLDLILKKLDGFEFE